MFFKRKFSHLSYSFAYKRFAETKTTWDILTDSSISSGYDEKKVFFSAITIRILFIETEKRIVLIIKKLFLISQKRFGLDTQKKDAFTWEHNTCYLPDSCTVDDDDEENTIPWSSIFDGMLTYFTNFLIWLICIRIKRGRKNDQLNCNKMDIWWNFTCYNVLTLIYWQFEQTIIRWPLSF